MQINARNQYFRILCIMNNEFGKWNLEIVPNSTRLKQKRIFSYNVIQSKIQNNNLFVRDYSGIAIQFLQNYLYFDIYLRLNIILFRVKLHTCIFYTLSSSTDRNYFKCDYSQSFELSALFSREIIARLALRYQFVFVCVSVCFCMLHVFRVPPCDRAPCMRLHAPTPQKKKKMCRTESTADKRCWPTRVSDGLRPRRESRRR